ncbi:hypothetical protein LH407_04625 [Antiquaquibacter oligotrophicus]|uniref:hypothetical protein n=1 Tax=Antiquaquibacter oligotrophicus TaxID=2880260 RepID=UPI002AC98545|nr:hypothetical protein [Antiquaquibacter oligotrophicus]UDF14148.1 hypothetical protein LH407_04625 [Antiquaquibacter oligotrophicus]
MFTRSRAARIAASVVIAGGLLVGTSGCVFITPTATLNYYDPSDGVGATIGKVRVLNMLGIINEEGTAINLVTVLHNNGSITNVNIQFEEDGEKTTVTKPLRGGETLNLGTTPDDDTIVITGSDVEAGGLIPVYVQYGEEPGEELMVPVLEATGAYEDLAPAR